MVRQVVKNPKRVEGQKIYQQRTKKGQKVEDEGKDKVGDNNNGETEKKGYASK